MSFFRLSIDKLLTKLPTPVKFNESQKAMIEGLNENRFFVKKSFIYVYPNDYK